MIGYRAKIERKFAQSNMNQSFQMMRFYPNPLNVSAEDGVTYISEETALKLANLPQYASSSNEVGPELDFIPQSTPLLESLQSKAK